MVQVEFLYNFPSAFSSAILISPYVYAIVVVEVWTGMFVEKFVGVNDCLVLQGCGDHFRGK